MMAWVIFYTLAQSLLLLSGTIPLFTGLCLQWTRIQLPPSSKAHLSPALLETSDSKWRMLSWDLYNLVANYLYISFLFQCSVVSNSLQPHGLQPSRLLCPWTFSGKITGAGCHSSSSRSSRPRDQAYIFCVSYIGSWTHGRSEGKESACNAGDPSSIPGSGISPREGNGNPLQYSCLENPMDRGAWCIIVRGVAKSQKGLSN